MVIIFQSLIVLIESLIIFSIFRKCKIIDPIFIFGCLLFFYSNSLFFDYIFFGIDQIYLESYGYTYYLDSIQNLYLMLYALLFIVSTWYFSNNIFSFKNRTIKTIELSKDISNTDFLLVTISLITILFFIIVNLKNFRFNLRTSDSLFEFLIINISIYLLILITIHKNFHKYLKFFLIFFIFLYGFISYQRELIVFSLYMLMIILNLKNNFKFYLYIIFVILILGFSKFLTNIFKIFFNNNSMYDDFNFNYFSFTLIDPASGYYIFDSIVNDIHYHSAFIASIFTQPYYQIIRVFSEIKNLSPAEFTTEFLTHNQMGTAYSIFAESYLNFGVAGAIIFPFLFINLFFILKKYFSSCSLIYLFFWFVFFLKIVRTDLTTTLKIYIFPLIISFFIILLSNYFNKNVFKKHHFS